MRLLLVAALLLGACQRPLAVAPPARSLRLVVLVVVDQLPSWSFEKRAPLMRGGIARLLRDGFFWPRARYPYAATFTAPGHVALGTGAPPAVTGILANSWYRRDVGKVVESTWDPLSPRLGVPEPIGTSPAMVRVDGVGDMVVRAGGKSVGVGVKDRGAMLPAGRRPTLAVWFDSRSGRFTTSRWYVSAVPGWVEELARVSPVAPRARGFLWRPVDPALLAANALVPDDGPGEGSEAMFPHQFPDDDRAIELATKVSPLGVTVTRELAEAALAGEGLGQDDVPDFLSVSIAPTDYVGHHFGQESWESLDVLLRVDDELAVLFATLDARVGAGRWAAILTTDHGAARMVEHTGGRRISMQDVARALGRPVAAVREPYVYLGAPATDAELDALVTAVARVDGIGAAYRTDRVSGDCAARAEPERSVCWSIDPERAGEIYFTPRAGSILLNAENDPTTHGTPNPEDVTVPIILYAPGLVAPGRSDEPVSILRVAPTLARLLGVAAPPAAREPPLR